MTKSTKASNAKKADFYAPLKAQIAELKATQKRLNARKELSEQEAATLSGLSTKISYREQMLRASEDTLAYLAELKIDLDRLKRNTVPKVLALAEMACSGQRKAFNGDKYVFQMFERILGNEQIESDFTISAGDLKKNLGAPCQVSGHVKGQKTLTQPFEVIKALEIVTGKPISRGRDGEARTFTLSLQDAAIKAINAKCLSAQ